MDGNNTMKISLIIPCYNEEAALPFIYKELVLVSSQLKDYEFEYLFVNDGSSDRTLSILKELAASDPRVNYYSFSRNFGKEAAMFAGFCNAGGDYVAVMDADLQDPPSLLPQMLEILQTGEYDSVATRRVSRDGEPKIRSFFARSFYKIINSLLTLPVFSFCIGQSTDQIPEDFTHFLARLIITFYLLQKFGFFWSFPHSAKFTDCIKYVLNFMIHLLHSRLKFFNIFR